MRISFDMDHTLVPYDIKGRSEADCKLFNGDLLRKGAIKLLKELQKEHELWIYTTSFRGPINLKFSSWLKGIKIKKVVNDDEHRKIIKSYQFHKTPTKYPKHYDIDLHIDDSKGVKMEGDEFGFDVLQIDSLADNWAELILNKVNIS